MSGAGRLGDAGRLAAATIALLALLTVGAFLVSQRLKREPLVVDRVDYVALGLTPNSDAPWSFSPNGDCQRDSMTIRFRTTRSDRDDVEVIDTEDRVVATLAEDRFFKRYREHLLVWDGTDDEGRLVEQDRYRIRITMRGLDRVLYLPGRMKLRDLPPADSRCGPGREGGAAP